MGTSYGRSCPAPPRTIGSGLLIKEIAIFCHWPWLRDRLADARICKKVAATRAGESLVAQTSMGSAAALPARVLPEERDPVAVLNGAVEGVSKTQDGVVH